MSGDTGFLAGRMSPTQIRNYVERRRAESEPEKKAQNVLGQWADYLARCKTLGRDRDDPMIYRPRELKRRHDEAVEEVRRWQMLKEVARDGGLARQKAERMRQRFPGAEEVLAEIREKYEYAGKDYRIRVPAFLAEIVAEGRALLLAQGGAARDAYYTIEVEPGGTIRQHRGMYDEGPEIDAEKKITDLELPLETPAGAKGAQGGRKSSAPCGPPAGGG